jgi:hypothetical protein
MTTAAPPSRWTRSGTKYPPRIIVHGPGGIGKTTLAASFPGAVVLRTEDGLGLLDVPHTEIASDYEGITGPIGELFAMEEPGTLVLDSLDWAEPSVWAETCSRLKVSSIEEPGFGKGYVAADEVWRELFSGLTALNRRGWCVVLIAHSAIVTYKDPMSEGYDRIVLKLHKRAAALAVEWADLVMYAHEERTVNERKDKRGNRAIGTGSRVLATAPSPAYEAKNRYNLPPLIRLDADTLIAALRDNGAVLPTTSES